MHKTGETIESVGELKHGPRQFCCVCLRTVTRFETRTDYWSDGSVRLWHACAEHADRV